MTRELKHIAIAVLVVCCAAFIRCANKMQPQGGPKDSLPPVVKLMTPENGQRHFTGKRIFIEFDEYLQLSDVNKEFFSSPLMKYTPSISIREKGVRIDLRDTLLPNRTYALNFGTSVRDNNEGNILYGLRYVLSTGPAIDSMIMTGYTADASRGDSVGRAFIFFFDSLAHFGPSRPVKPPLVVDSLALDSLARVDSLRKDSIATAHSTLSEREKARIEKREKLRKEREKARIAREQLRERLRQTREKARMKRRESLAAAKNPAIADSIAMADSLAAAAADTLPLRSYITPEYDSLLFLGTPSAVARSENNGIFIAQNLKDVPYRVYAVQDNNGNQKYDPGVDKAAFLDSLYNPADPALPPFSIWLDQYRHYPTADPQLYFRLFGETPKRRQNLTSSERPARHQALLRFSAPWPEIDTLRFDSVPDDRVIREFVTADRDTISLWFNMAPEALPDTIKGRISYRRTDSLGELRPHSQDLKLAWKLVETREEIREREKEERDRKRAEEEGEEYTPPEKPNPFKFKVDAAAEVNPEKSIPIEFTLPLAEIDSAAISLTSRAVGLDGNPMGDPSPQVFHMVRDTMNIRKWVITSEWDEELAYNLLVPQGAFVDIAGERNDTLKADFKIMKRSKFATLNLNVRGKSPEAKYIIQILGSNGNVEKEIKDVSSGPYVLYYISEGEMQIRITEDMNGNGKWDSGNIVGRLQPERTEFYVGPTGSKIVPSRSNWEVDLDLDMAIIFAPVSIEKIRRDLEQAEDARIAKWLEGADERAAERKRQEEQQKGTTSGLGFGGALGGARQQIQSVGGMGSMGGMGGGMPMGGMQQPIY
jgi:uncharacterized membrane protein